MTNDPGIGRPTGYGNAGAGSTAPSAASASPKFPFTAIPSAVPAAASSNAAATTDELGRKLVEQGFGSVSVSRFGADILLGIECNGRVSVRLATDTALLVAEHIRKLALSRTKPAATDAAAAARAVDRGTEAEATDVR